MNTPLLIAVVLAPQPDDSPPYTEVGDDYGEIGEDYSEMGGE